MNSGKEPRGMRIASDLADEIEHYGYCVVPTVLNATEINQLRATANAVLDERGIAKSGGTVLPNAAVTAPEIAWVLTHDAILRSVHAALGCPHPVFTLEADLHRNLINGKWHKDTGEKVMENGYFGLDPFGRDDCRVVKVAIYLQDHSDGRGLRVRPGSHRSRDLGSGAEVEIASRAGDIVLFDVRISHRGVRPNALDVLAVGITRFMPARRRWERMASLRRRIGAWTIHPDRLAIYFAFGIPNEWSEAFASRNMRRQLSQHGDGNVELPAELLRAFATSQVRVADMSAL